MGERGAGENGMGAAHEGGVLPGGGLPKVRGVLLLLIHMIAAS